MAMGCHAHRVLWVALLLAFAILALVQSVAQAGTPAWAETHELFRGAPPPGALDAGSPALMNVPSSTTTSVEQIVIRRARTPITPLTEPALTPSPVFTTPIPTDEPLFELKPMPLPPPHQGLVP